MRPLRLFIVILALAGFAGLNGLAAAPLRLEIITLQHRSAQELMPTLKPLLAEGGTLTGRDNQLIVKTTATNLGEIKQLLQRLDQAARRLIIYVRQAANSRQQTSEHALTGRYATGDVTLSGGEHAPANTSTKTSRSASARATDRRGNTIAYRSRDTHSAEHDDVLFHVQAVEGRPALIRSGQSIPLANPQTLITPTGLITTDTITYRDVVSGFYVLPRLAGEQVTLFIAPQRSSLDEKDSSTVKTQGLATTVSGRLGEWLDLGASSGSSRRREGGLSSGSTSSSRQQQGLQLKVIELR